MTARFCDRCSRACGDAYATEDCDLTVCVCSPEPHPASDARPDELRQMQARINAVLRQFAEVITGKPTKADCTLAGPAKGDPQ